MPKKKKRVVLMLPCETAKQKLDWQKAAKRDGKRYLTEWARGVLDAAAGVVS